MKLTVKYEWDIETIDENGDIQDHNFSDKCPGIPDENGQEIVLVRDVGNSEKGVVQRYWAYVVNGALPEFFENANQKAVNLRVPNRFHKELVSKIKKD